MAKGVLSQIRKRYALSRDEITADIVRCDLSYSPETGDFRWIAHRVGVQSGRKAGTINNHGYVTIPLRGVHFQAHRVAWAHYFGKFPSGQIDHINGDKTDNRICNLRLASPSQNKANTKAQSNNSHKVKGAFWSAKDAKWIVRIQKSGVRKTVGMFENIDDARKAYARAAEELFGEFAHKNP